MKTQEEKRWERMQQLLLAESQGKSPVRISSQRTLFGIKSHVERVVEKVAAEDTEKCIERAQSRDQYTEDRLGAVRESGGTVSFDSPDYKEEDDVMGSIAGGYF